VGASLALLTLLVTPVGAFAAQGSGDTPVTGTIVTYYTLGAPAAIDLGTSISSASDITRGPYNITVNTNDSTITQCGITVADKDAATKTTNSGRLSNGSYHLANPLFVQGGAVTNAVLGQSPVALRTPGTLLASANIDNFNVVQGITSADLAHPGNYSITLTFTATFQ